MSETRGLTYFQPVWPIFQPDTKKLTSSYGNDCIDQVQECWAAMKTATDRTVIGEKPGTMSIFIAFQAICVATRWTMLRNPASQNYLVNLAVLNYHISSPLPRLAQKRDTELAVVIIWICRFVRTSFKHFWISSSVILRASKISLKVWGTPLASWGTNEKKN